MILGTWGAGWAGYQWGPWAGAASAASSAARSAGCCTPSPRSPSASTTSSPASRSTSSRPASRGSCPSCSTPASRGGGADPVAADRRAARPRSTCRCSPAARTCSAGWSRHHWFLVSDLAGRAARPRCTTSTSSTVIAVLLFPLVGFVLWRTAFGLRLRSCGENPVGGGVARRQRLPVQVRRRDRLRRAGRARRRCSSSSFAGIYQEGQTGGRGFIGLAAMIFGNWRPGGLAAGRRLFGFTDALQLRSGSSAVHALLLLARDRCSARSAIWWLRQGRRMARRRRSSASASRVLLGYLGHRRRCPTRSPSVRRTSSTLLVLALASQRLRPPQGRRHALPTRRGAVTRRERRRASTGTRCARRRVEAMERAYAPYSQFPVGAAGAGRRRPGRRRLQRRERLLRPGPVRRVRPGLRAARDRRRPAGRGRLRRRRRAAR